MHTVFIKRLRNDNKLVRVLILPQINIISIWNSKLRKIIKLWLPLKLECSENDEFLDMMQCKKWYEINDMKRMLCYQKKMYDLKFQLNYLNTNIDLRRSNHLFERLFFVK